MGAEFSAEEREAYAERGFVVRQRVLDEARLGPLREAVEDIHARIAAAAETAERTDWVDDKRYQDLLGSTVKWEWARGSRDIRSMEPFRHLDARVEDLIDDPRLWRPLCALLDCKEVSLFTDKLNFKRPSGSPFPWHQDTPYWAFGCPHVERLSSLQVYLDDATVDNGCLWVLPGSHRHGFLPKFEDRGVLGRLYTDLDALGDVEPTAIEAPAGSVIYFQGHLVHGSQRNRSAASRRAIVLTYQPAGHPLWREEAERPVPRL